MKCIPAILFCVLLSIKAASQRTIKGRVVNEATGTAVAGSSVFITNTSRGTVTDNAGRFEINDVPPGKHELVISSIGYETNVFAFTESQLPLQLKVELTIKVKEMENVTVEPFTEEGWDKWGNYFVKNFIGETESASRCKIRNTQDIKFRFYKKTNRLIAYADVPIIIENKALGYTINYKLEEFETDFSKKSLLFVGYSLFEDLQKEGSYRNRVQRKREEAYQGSIMHFMRSLYTNKLKEEGFEIRRLKIIPNYEKKRVQQIYKSGRLVSSHGNIGVTITTHQDTTTGFPPDSVAYYQQILRQRDNIEEYGSHLLSADSLVTMIEGVFKYVEFDDYLYIKFNKELEEERYLTTIFPTRKAGPQQSTVTLLGKKIIVVDENGFYFDSKEFYTSGYWGWSEKMGDNLPLDYVPGK
jgi:CarboxypepD_reg-like domain